MNESNLYFSEQVAAASERVSTAFDSTLVYSVGVFCTYEGRLYKFVEVKKAGAWSSSAVVETTMANEIYILNTTGIGTGYDVTLSVPASGWTGSAAPYAQTVQALGMTAGKGVIYALMTEDSTASASEKENYRLITGLQQGPNTVTFYASTKPSIDMSIRCFCGAGSEEATDIEVVSDAFDAAKAYSAGSYCIYGDTLYKFNSDKSKGAWDASKVTSTNVGTELSSLNAKFQSGCVDFSNNPETTWKYVAFTKAFKSTPNVVLSLDTGDPNNVHVASASVQKDGFTIRLIVDKAPDALSVYWLAIGQ